MNKRIAELIVRRTACLSAIVPDVDDLKFINDIFLEIREAVISERDEPRPVSMLLYCPRCFKQHVDVEETEDEFEACMQLKNPPIGKPERWTNPPHATHTCLHCGHLWRPSNEATRGVLSLPVLSDHHGERIRATKPVPRADPA